MIDALGERERERLTTAITHAHTHPHIYGARDKSSIPTAKGTLLPGTQGWISLSPSGIYYYYYYYYYYHYATVLSV
jgi:hypothetical protein